MTTLTQANDQWNTRPADQRFASLADLHAAVQHHRDMAVEAPGIDLKTLRVELQKPDGETPEPVLVSGTGLTARFTNHSFGQVARLLDAPASYLRKLPASLASANLNNGIRTLEDATPAKALFSQNGHLRLRAMTGEGYTRIWNRDVTSRLIQLTEQSPEWQPAPAAFDGSRGLYASEKDMFAFLVDNERPIFESLPGGGLGRGFFVSNSEVGDASFRVTTFLYEYVCGNHRVWGAQGVQELRIAHVGNADERAFSKLSIELRKYADSSAAETEGRIESCRRMTLGATKDEVLDKVFGLNTGLSRKQIGAGYDRAVEQEARYGAPNTVWGFTGGLTEVARDLPNADARVELERKAGKVMQIAF